MDQIPDNSLSDPDRFLSVLCFPFGYGLALTITLAARVCGCQYSVDALPMTQCAGQIHRSLLDAFTKLRRAR